MGVSCIHEAVQELCAIQNMGAHPDEIADLMTQSGFEATRRDEFKLARCGNCVLQVGAMIGLKMPNDWGFVYDMTVAPVFEDRKTRIDDVCISDQL